jgi:hypothetical protein
MSAGAEKLAALRQLLAERYPDGSRASGRVLVTGITALDEAAGGLPLGAVTELVCAAPSCGGQLFVGQLLDVTRRERIRAALVDAGDAFDPESYAADMLAHLVWVRGVGDTDAALQAADLLVRDANLGLVVLDLRRAPERDLRRIPGPQWYRFQRAVEPADLAFVVLTPRASVPSAQLRLVLAEAQALPALARERPGLAAQLAPVLQRQRRQVSAG